MDEDEINMWYEDEKQALLDEYIAKLETTEDKNAEQERFDKKMEELYQKYLKKMDREIKSSLRKQLFDRKKKAFLEKHNLVKKKDEKKQ